MPDIDKTDDKKVKDDDKPDPMATMAEGFKEMADSMKATIAAATPKPTEIPIKDDSNERKAAAQKRYNTAREKAGEQMAAGESADAMETFMGGVIELQNANTPNPENSPATKASIASAKKLSRADNKEMFDKYGAEIEADMASQSTDLRINPESWDDAVNRTKANHIDDILADRAKANAEDIKKAEEDATANALLPPVAQRGRVTRTASEGINADNLTEEQLDAASACDLTPEQYAEATENYEKHVQKGGMVLFMNEPATGKGLKVKPGAF